jgi:hypothetical protein
MEVRGQLHVPAALPPLRIHVPIESEATWATDLILTLWKREKYSALAGIRNPDRPACSLITDSCHYMYDSCMSKDIITICHGEKVRFCVVGVRLQQTALSLWRSYHGEVVVAYYHRWQQCAQNYAIWRIRLYHNVNSGQTQKQKGRGRGTKGIKKMKKGLGKKKKRKEILLLWL